MKHKFTITLTLLAMFLVTQFIGITVLNAYAPTVTETLNQTTGKPIIDIEQPALPFGLEYEENTDPLPNFVSIIFAIIFAAAIFGFLMKYNLKFVMRSWFFLVVVISLGITLYPLLQKFIPHTQLITIQIATLMIALPLAFFKIIKPNIYIHNATELLIYPGIAIIIVSLIYSPANKMAGIFFAIALLILISIYDAWAVWKSGIMQKMAKYQMETLQIFGGFLLPSMSEKEKEKLRKLKEKYKNKKIPTTAKKRKFKVNLAILGGGDVIFPIITAGVFMWTFPEQALFGINGLIPALFIIAGALLGLTYLFLNTKKGKAYPAMPYISTGIFIGMILWKIFI
jgi:presenilin-like A22 family membrane protease